MATVEITGENFDEIVASKDVVLLDFWAPRCGPCRSFAPVYEKASKAFPEVVFAKIDTEAQQDLAASFNVLSIPTLMIIREQVVLFSQSGALPEKTLVGLVEKALNLDVAEVHRHVLTQRRELPVALKPNSSAETALQERAHVVGVSSEKQVPELVTFDVKRGAEGFGAPTEEVGRALYPTLATRSPILADGVHVEPGANVYAAGAGDFLEHRRTCDVPSLLEECVS